MRIPRSSHVSWFTCLSRACSLYMWLDFCVLYRLQQYSIFISSQDVQSKYKGSGATAGTKKHQLLFLLKVLYCKILKFSLFFGFVFYAYLCEKCYKPITVQYCLADCAYWIPSLTLLDMGTNWVQKCAIGKKHFCMQRTYCNFRCFYLTFWTTGSQSLQLVKGDGDLTLSSEQQYSST